MATKGQAHVAFLENVISRGGRIDQAQFVFDKSDFGKANPRFILTLNQNQNLSLQELSWSPELEEYLLLRRPTRMASIENEIERVANILSNNLKTAENSYGEDFALSVFVEYLMQHTNYGLTEILNDVPGGNPSRRTQQYLDCAGFIKSAIEGLQNTLVLALGYPNGPETIRLMSRSLALVLDEKFHITLRSKLFPR